MMPLAKINYEKLAVAVAIPLAVLLAIASIFIGSLNYLMVSILLFISSIIWLRIRNTFLIEHISQKASSQAFIILSILYFCLLSYSIISIYNRDITLVRPVQYFIATAFMAGIVSAEIFLLPSIKYRLIIIAQIIILGLSLILTQFYLYPTVIGVDPWHHLMFTVEILEKGSIPSKSAYSMLPIFHLDIGITSLILETDYRISSILSIGIPYVICTVLAIYYVASRVLNNTIGLLAALLLVLASYQIRMGIWIIPNALGIIFILFVLLILVKMQRGGSMPLALLVMILSSALILTHTIASLCLAIIFVVWGISTIIFTHKKHPYSRLVFIFAIVFSISTIFWWTYATGHIHTLIKLLELRFSHDYFNRTDSIDRIISNALATYYASIPIVEKAFAFIGVYIYTAFAFIGYIYVYKNKNNKTTAIPVITASIVMAIIPFTSSILGISIIEERWLAIAQCLGTIPLAITIAGVVHLIKDYKLKTIVTACIILIIFIATVMSPMANIDSPILSSHTSIRSGYTEGEMIAVSFNINMGERNISSDWDIATRGSSVLHTFFDLEGKRIISIEKALIENNITKGGKSVLVRDEIIDNPLNIHGRAYLLDYDLWESLEKNNFNLIYHNNDARIYI